MRPSDEGQLITQAKRHDPNAVSELYNRHVDQIYQYVFNRLGETALAEDITADVFLRALESLAVYEDHGVPFAAWLYRIAQARVIDYWRRTQRRATVPFEERDLPNWLVEEAADDDVLQRDRLAAGLAYLTEEQQQVIVLKFMQGLHNAEIAQIMGKTEGAVKALQRRGLETLARLLRK